MLNVYEKINKKTYLALKRSGRIGKALPSMCVLVIKPDKDGKPHRAAPIQSLSLFHPAPVLTSNMMGSLLEAPSKMSPSQLLISAYLLPSHPKKIALHNICTPSISTVAPHWMYPSKHLLNLRLLPRLIVTMIRSVAFLTSFLAMPKSPLTTMAPSIKVFFIILRKLASNLSSRETFAPVKSILWSLSRILSNPGLPSLPTTCSFPATPPLARS